VAGKANFFLPVPVLRKVFRGKVLAGLKRLPRVGQLCRTASARVLGDNQQFARLLRRLRLRRWVVYAKAPVGGPRAVPSLFVDNY
jgi:hypothetical protein